MPQNIYTKPMSGSTIPALPIQYYPQNYQIEIHNHPARFRVVDIGRRGGKTELAENEVIKRAVDKPSIQYPYWLVAPTFRQVKAINWTRLKILLKPDNEWKFNEQELYAEHPRFGTRIELKGADNEESLRGVGLSGVVLDECSTIKANVWPEIIRPMLADRQGWALFISTPKGRNWFYDLFIKGFGNDKNWKSWKFPTSVNKYINKEEIEQAKKDMSERLYRQEFLAEFLDDETGVFKRVRSCIVGDLINPIIGRFYVIGIDLAKSEDFTVLTVIDSKTREVVAFERFQNIDWREQKIRIQILAARYNNALCVIDASGVGDPIVEDLQNAGVSLYYNEGKPGFKFTNESKCKLIEQLAIAIEQRQITFPNIEVLVSELMNYEYSITDNGRITYSAPSGKHDDCVISIALAVWGIRSYLYTAQVSSKQLEDFPVDRQGKGYEEEEYERIEVTSNTGY